MLIEYFETFKQCLREGDTWNPDQNFSIDIIARSVDTNDPTTYILDFRMQPSAKHEIWANYQPDSVTVNLVI